MSFPTSARTNNKWAVAHLGTIQAAPIDCDPQSELTGWLLFDTVHADEAETPARSLARMRACSDVLVRSWSCRFAMRPSLR